MAAGVAVGIGATLWGERRVRRRIRRVAGRLAPVEMADDAASSARHIGDLLRDAVATGRHERSRREAELWNRLEGHRQGPR